MRKDTEYSFCSTIATVTSATLAQGKTFDVLSLLQSSIQQKKSKPPQLEVSVVVCAYNEAESIPALYEELRREMESLGCSYELLFIDDASEDETKHVIHELSAADSHLRGLTLLRNTKKGGALQLGFEQARGNVIVTMDADLQDDPAEIGKLLEEIKKGAQAVIGWKQFRRDSFWRRSQSYVMNLLTSVLLRKRFYDMNSGIKAYQADVVKHIHISGSLYRFIPHLLCAEGYRVTEVPVHHRARKHGRSKFGLMHRLRGPFDLMTVIFLSRFGDRPFHFFGRIGLFLFLAGMGIGAYLSVLWFQGASIGGRPLLMLSVLFMVLGLQIASVGLVGELVLHTRKKRQVPYRKLDNTKTQT